MKKDRRKYGAVKDDAGSWRISAEPENPPPTEKQIAAVVYLLNAMENADEKCIALLVYLDGRENPGG